MRLTISLLVVLSLSVFNVGLPGASPAGWVTAAWAAPRAVHGVQARKKKRSSRPKKAKAVKKPDKPKKNDPGFAL
jgi:hypothetical protein